MAIRFALTLAVVIFAAACSQPRSQAMEVPYWRTLDSVNIFVSVFHIKPIRSSGSFIQIPQQLLSGG